MNWRTAADVRGSVAGNRRVQLGSSGTGGNTDSLQCNGSTQSTYPQSSYGVITYALVSAYFPFILSFIRASFSVLSRLSASAGNQKATHASATA
jgi:hypothetical protein